MNKLFLALAMCLGVAVISGCAEEVVYADPSTAVATVNGTVEFCDDWGCRMVSAPYYMYNNEVIYWDAHFGCWIGPRGYWVGGLWHLGWVEGYHGWYGVHAYHRWVSRPGGWRAGDGFHGYGPPGGGHVVRGGGGGHFGGHGHR